MKTLTLEIPSLLDFDENEDKLLLALTLFEKGKLTLGQASEMLGVTKEAFIEILGLNGVSLFNNSLSELDEDLKHAQNYHR